MNSSDNITDADIYARVSKDSGTVIDKSNSAHEKNPDKHTDVFTPIPERSPYEDVGYEELYEEAGSWIVSYTVVGQPQVDALNYATAVPVDVITEGGVDETSHMTFSTPHTEPRVTFGEGPILPTNTLVAQAMCVLDQDQIVDVLPHPDDATRIGSNNRSANGSLDHVVNHLTEYSAPTVDVTDIEQNSGQISADNEAWVALYNERRYATNDGEDSDLETFMPVSDVSISETAEQRSHIKIELTDNAVQPWDGPRNLGEWNIQATRAYVVPESLVPNGE
jgi:hypothetical protein